MNKPAALAQLQAQWRENPRLRYGGMVIAAILGVQGLLMLSDRLQARKAAYAADLQMLSRLEGLRKETVWRERAKTASAKLEAVSGQIPEVTGKGMAQAESQAAGEGQPDAGKKDDGNVVDAEFEEVKKDKQ